MIMQRIPPVDPAAGSGTNRKNFDMPNERWQSQRKAAWAKLGRSDTPDRQVEETANQMITEHAPVQRAVRDLAAVAADGGSRLRCRPKWNTATLMRRGLKG
jgi:hypothetical protein